MDEQLVGQPVFSEDGSKLGTVKEVRGQYVKVDVALQPDYWLRSDVLQPDAGGWLVAQADAKHYGEPQETATDGATATRPALSPLMDTGPQTRRDGAAPPAELHPQAIAERAPEAAQVRASHAGEQALQLREERLRVETQPEQMGTARLTTRVVEFTETVQVPLREERVVIERLPGGGEVIVAGRALAEGERVEVVVRRERARVEKDVVELERLAVRREVVEHRERVDATLRNEELVVAAQGDADVSGDAAPRT